MKKLFGTSGIRANNEFFSPIFCFSIGKAFAIFLKNCSLLQPLVIIGHDTRPHSRDQILPYLTSGIMSENIDVVDAGVIPVPAVNYAAIHSSKSAGIMISGSHIDVNSNGLKFFFDREEITKQHELAIETIYNSLVNQSAPAPTHTDTDLNSFQNYLDHLVQLYENKFAKKIIIDPGNGAQTETIKQFCQIVGIHAIFINASLQNTLISRDTETEGAFNELQDAVIQNKANLGVGFDSDGDRVIFVDEMGQFIPGDYSGSILSKYHRTNVIVTPINTSDVVNHTGKEVVRTKVGSPYVIEAMKKYGSSFGFESNGGGIDSDIMFSRDGGSSFVKILNIMAYTNTSFSELVNQFPRFFIRRTKFDCPTDKYEVILQNSPSFHNSHKIDKTDGIKIRLDPSTWVLFRPSHNAPEFRIFVQSDSQTKSDSLLSEALIFAKKYV